VQHAFINVSKRHENIGKSRAKCMALKKLNESWKAGVRIEAKASG
jgi:hypothetical protein